MNLPNIPENVEGNASHFTSAARWILTQWNKDFGRPLSNVMLGTDMGNNVNSFHKEYLNWVTHIQRRDDVDWPADDMICHLIHEMIFKMKIESLDVCKKAGIFQIEEIPMDTSN